VGIAGYYRITSADVMGKIVAGQRKAIRLGFSSRMERFSQTKPQFSKND
jgi:hypothetical protein